MQLKETIFFTNTAPKAYTYTLIHVHVSSLSSVHSPDFMWHRRLYSYFDFFLSRGVQSPDFTHSYSLVGQD